MRVSFDQVFQTNPNGSITPRCGVRIGGVTMGPGVTFTRGVSFSGVDIANYEGHDLEVEKQEDGTVVINSVY